jgi:hypothetical protein
MIIAPFTNVLAVILLVEVFILAIAGNASDATKAII